MTELRLAMLGIASAFLVVACGPSAPEAPAETEVPAQPDAAVETQDLATTLADRPEGDRVRDGGRKPAEVLSIVGVEAGMDVLDLIAAGGWYTEVLSVAVGTDGPEFRGVAIDGGKDEAVPGDRSRGHGPTTMAHVPQLLAGFRVVRV